MENKETKSKEILEIIAINEKNSKAGRIYYSVETDKGNFSCFEFDLVNDLKKAFGKKVQCEVASNDRGFKNIRKAFGVIETEKVNITKKESNGNGEIQEARAMKDQSIYTSYCKDIFVAIRTDPEAKDLKSSTIMQVAIELVKQAKDAFK